MTGFQSYYQYDAFDVGNVNINTKLINLKIPLISYPQRGTLPSVDFWVNYSPSLWKYTCGSYCTWSPTSLRFGISFQQLLPYVGVARFHTDLHVQPVDYAYHAFDPTGAQHVLGWTSPTMMESVDGSGFRFDGTNITDKNGITYCWAQRGCVMRDPNGNAVTVDQQTGDTIDSVGRHLVGLNYSLLQPGCTTSSLLGPNGGTAPFTVCVSTVNISTTFSWPVGSHQYIGSVNMITSIIRPNGTSWSFTYDNYGDLQSIGTPMGGTISFTYGSLSSTLGGGAPYYLLVSTRAVDAHDSSGAHSWSYSTTQSGQLMMTDPLGNDTVYTITHNGNQDIQSTNVDYYNGSHTNPQNLIKSEFTQNLVSGPNPFFYIDNNSSAYAAIPIYTTTIWASGRVSKTCLLYDGLQNVPCAPIYSPGQIFTDNNPDGHGTQYPFTYGSVIQTSDYDFGNGAAGALLRQTNNQYLWQGNSNYQSANLLSLVSSSAILDSSGAQFAQTSYGYDENNGSPQGVFGNETVGYAVAERWHISGDEHSVRHARNANSKD